MRYRSPPKGIPHPGTVEKKRKIIFALICIFSVILAVLIGRVIGLAIREKNIPKTPEEMWEDLYQNYHHIEDSGGSIRYTKTICGLLTNDYYTVWPEDRFPAMKEEDRIEKSPERITKPQVRWLENKIKKNPEILEREPYIPVFSSKTGRLESTREAVVIYKLYGSLYPIKTISAVYLEKDKAPRQQKFYIDLLTGELPPEGLIQTIKDIEPEYIQNAYKGEQT